MNKEKYLIAVDLDGTLLPDYATVDERLKKVVKVLMNKGHKFIIETGRPFRSSIFVYNALGLDTPLINYNGCLITHPLDKSYNVLNETMNYHDLLKIYNECDNKIDNIFCEVDDHIFLKKEEEKIIPLLHYNELSTLTIGDLNNTLKDNANGCLLTANRENALYIQKYVQDNFPNTMGARIWSWGDYENIVEIYPTKENKGTSLKRVADELGFKKENIIAIGDSHNDLEMISYAGIGVAMNNAHDCLKKIADRITEKTCKEVGVYYFLCDFFGLDSITLEEK